MIRTRRHRPPFRSTARLSLEVLEARCLLDAGFLQTNLVSDVPGLATSTDPNLKNPWGLAAGPGGPFWVSDNNAGVSTLYNGAGQPFPVFNPLVVTIPIGSATPAGTKGTPTGIVFNGSKTDFVVSEGGNSGAAIFIFDTLDGTISGWSPGVSPTNAIRVVDNSASGASYTGLALANNGSGNFLYAANNSAGTIDVFNNTFKQVTLAGSFKDPNLPSGFAPYGIQLLHGKLYVSYAPQNFSPNGLVDVFDVNGHFLRRLVTGGKLDLPWGMAIAPHDFGQFSNALLVGNVGDGHINAYDPNSGAFRGQLEDTNGQPFTEPGLWSLKFGNDGLAGSSDSLFFTAGIDGYADGLVGSLTVPQHAVASHTIHESIIPHLPPSPTLFVFTNAPTGPDTGDQNPYGIAFVPPHFAQGGPLNPGDILVSNFNNAANSQGMGRTIVRVTPNGQTSVFFQAPADIANVGLTTALGVLKRGFVLVGNVPTTDGTSNTVMAGSLMIIDKDGNLVQNLTDSALLNGPWDLTINDQGDRAQVFVSNVLSGTVTRIDLRIPPHSNPIVESETMIASGYAHRTDPSAVVVGPTGLAYDAKHDILYVASTADNEIFAISDAKDRKSDGGTGRLVVKDNTHLHGPLALLLAPNGDLITANGDAVNPDSKQPSEIVEFTPRGKFVGQISLNPGPDAGFGIALQFAAPDSQIRFAAVDDNTNTVHVWNIDLDNESPAKHEDSSSDVRTRSGERPQGDNMAAATSAFFASLASGRGDSHRHLVDDLLSARLESGTPSQPAQTSGATGRNIGPTFGSSRALARSAHITALDIAFEDSDPGLFR
jgi:uncharacterized protein (TIGR03118 family)